MKKNLSFFFTMLFCIVFTNSYSQIQYGLSEANLTSKGIGREVTFTNPYTNSSMDTFAGEMIATVDGNSTKFYCIDIRRRLTFPDVCHRDSAITNPKIVYILNHYRPYAANPDSLTDNEKERAAIQCAIWHFSDGVNANTITSNSIKNRTLEIIADANANGAFTDVVTTISIEPGVSPDDFYVKTLDQNGNGIAVNNIVLTYDMGTLSTYNVNTNASGISPDVTVTGPGTGVLTATAMVMIPQGITYTCVGKQRLVIAMPTIGERKVVSDWGALPVELISFIANSTNRNVTLNWSTANEVNNAGFDIERKSVSSSEWTKIGNVAGNGTTSNPQSYTYTDRNLSAGSYNYRLKQIDYNGNFEYFNLGTEVEVGNPTDYALSQNYPNPFNPTTKINFDLAKEGFVSIKVFDNLGKEVATLVNEFKNTGYYTVEFDARNLTSGMYYYRMEVNGFTKVLKMSLIK
ncbi:MAG: hypothetical protein HGGPFJEG_02448 [Ignavibacteria bacterium]|nr:hypothetical protein [Ignavibacteria bacterium]